jgi:SAM-dependent methyltransferase
MKDRLQPFEQHADRYEAWFERHPAAYQSELAAVRELWPASADGIEIGVGAGHFAAPLGIRRGVEPAAAMRRLAEERGVCVVDGVAEHLPFPDDCCDAALMVTTICFVDDPVQSIREMFRILRPGGCAVVGFVDRESPLGREYQRKAGSSLFYGPARFFSAAEVAALMTEAGFVKVEYRQTLFSHPEEMQVPDAVRSGSGEGSFVVLRGHRREVTSCGR